METPGTRYVLDFACTLTVVKIGCFTFFLSVNFIVSVCERIYIQFTYSITKNPIVLTMKDEVIRLKSVIFL